MKKLLLIFILFPFCGISQPSIQCDSITIFDSDFDNIFQNEFSNIKGDSILAFRYCSNLNGCYNAIGLVCWKNNGKFNYKILKNKGLKFKSKKIVNRKTKKHLEAFYNQKLYLKTGPVIEKNTYFVDDGELGIFLFKTNLICWRFGIGNTHSEDERVLWGNKLLDLIK